MGTPTEYIKLTGTKLRETEKAVQFNVLKVQDEELEETVTHWFPFSQIKSQSTNPNVSGHDTISVADWICRSKELI
jgi:hypothetical protein